jgi:hypothetical protein
VLSITKRYDTSSSIRDSNIVDISDSGVYWFSKMLRKFLDDLLVTEV